MNSTNVSSPIGRVDDRQGWTGSPNGRGTMGIIWSCALTTFLCCWAVLINNVPEPGSSRFSLFTRKLLLLLVCAAAPEVILQVAMGQWSSARNSVKLFHESGFCDWTVRHGFYVDMGGLHLRSPDFPSFPINSKQLHYLIIRGYVNFPQIKEEQIRDKNKVDGMLRFITLLQTISFLINMILRATQHLAITAFELSTAAFVFSSFATTLFWVKKPADVQACDFLDTDTTISTIRIEGGVASDAVYTYTPLDFVGREEWPMSIMWSHALNICRRLHITGQPQQLPVQRFNNTAAPVIKDWFQTLFIIIGGVYFAIVVAGFNFSFPTRTEHVLWHAASFAAPFSALGGFLGLQVFFKWYPALRRRKGWAPRPSRETQETPKKDNSILRKTLRARFERIIGWMRNNSISKDPALDAPIRAIISTGAFFIFYLSARGYIMLADFIELRSLPKSAYQSLDWSSLAPYVP